MECVENRITRHCVVILKADSEARPGYRWRENYIKHAIHTRTEKWEANKTNARMQSAIQPMQLKYSTS